MNDLLAWTVEAHGGLERWERVGEIRMRGQMGGLELFHSDNDDEPVRVAHISVDKPRVSVSGFPEPNRGTFSTFVESLVQIERDSRGAAIHARRLDGIIKFRLRIAGYDGCPTRIGLRDLCERCIFR